MNVVDDRGHYNYLPKTLHPITWTVFLALGFANIRSREAAGTIHITQTASVLFYNETNSVVYPNLES